ncbi:MAG: amidohydrolase [Arenibacterium sp.]
MAQETADQICLGGSILTMVDATPTAEAVAISDGRILAVGDLSSVEAHRGEDTKVFDLEGRSLLPGFVDSHGHVVMGGLQALSANLLAPPDGEVTDIPSLLQTIAAWMDANEEAIESTGLIVGFGYDQSQLEELRHPTRQELDTVAREVPIIIVHQSGHFGVANSKALAKTGITAMSEDPPGGVIRRDVDGSPNGVLEENAFFLVLGQLFAVLDDDGMRAFAKAGAALWAKYGYTTGQEGRAAPAIVGILRDVAARGDLAIDVVAYVDVLIDREFVLSNMSRAYVDGVRVGGGKLTIDGSPQGFTAWRDRPYYDPIGPYPPGYVGYPAATPEQVVDAFDWAFKNDVQLLTHSNGEASTDLLLASVSSALVKHGAADRRPVLIHGQFLREDQVDGLKRLDIFPSLFPMHTFYWGDWHRDRTVGPLLADNISPTGWLVQRDMRFGSHHDAPVAFPDSMRVLDATVTRRSRSGDILGPAQRVDVMTALKALTLWPAWQHFEEADKGSIEVGKRADFVVLSEDPTAVDPETLDQLSIRMTIKDGQVIYQAGEE